MSFILHPSLKTVYAAAGSGVPQQFSFDSVASFEDNFQYDWTPEHHPHLTQWIDSSYSDNITGDPITSITDRHRGYHNTVNINGSLSIGSINSINAIETDGSAYIGQTLGGKPRTTSGNHIFAGVSFIDGVGSASDELWNLNNIWKITAGNSSQFNGAIQFYNKGNKTLNLIGGPYSGPIIHVTLFHYSQSSTSLTKDFYVFINGGGNVAAGTNQYDTPINVGNYTNLSIHNGLDGKMGEFLIFASADRADYSLFYLLYVQKIEGYLAHKWGLTSLLPSTHPYKTVHPV